MNTIKVFKVNDYEWWAGADLDSIKQAYLEHSKLDPDDEFDNPHELSEAELRSHTIHFDEGEEPATSTFEERLDELIAINATFPCYFAGTEY